MTARRMKTSSQTTLLSLALLFSACGEAPPAVEPADLVLRGGRIVTLEDDASEVQALAARDGRIVALGSSDDVASLVGPETRVFELEGRLAIPGFIEGHGHFLGIGDAKIQLDLRGAATWDDIVAQVAEAAADLEPGEWIRGRGWHQDKWTEAPTPAVEGFPVHASLSAASPDNPVILTHASGHAGFANAKALELAGIDGSTPDPPGGEILRDAAGPTGLLRETAQSLVHEARIASGGADREIGRMVELASEECLSKGITSFTDAGTSFEAIEGVKEAALAGKLGLRLWFMVRDSNEAIAAQMAEAKVKDFADGLVTVGGIKLSIDGALGSRGAWMLEPYSDAPEVSGLNLVPLDVAAETADLAIEHGVQLAIHAIGDRGNREVLDLFERTFEKHPGEDRRWRVEHAQHLHPDDIPRFGELDVVASVQGVHCTSDGPWVPDRIGDQRAEEGAYVWRKLAETGAVLVNGTDAPVEDVDPIASYYSSVSRLMNNGERFYPDQVMTRREALESYTKNAAWATFQEDDRGTLAVGKRADVTVLSQDILEIEESLIPDTRVEATIVGGRVAWEAP